MSLDLKSLGGADNFAPILTHGEDRLRAHLAELVRELILDDQAIWFECVEKHYDFERINAIISERHRVHVKAIESAIWEAVQEG